MNDKDNLLEILRNNGDLNDVKPKPNTQLTELQFAEWLTELKDLREENKVLTRDCLRLIKSNDKLRKKLKPIVEYKRLLKAAVEDMHIEDIWYACVKRIPNSPIHCPDGSNCFVWRYKDEALKLIES